MTLPSPGVVHVGHPFTSISKGEELRSCATALASLMEPSRIYDLYRCTPRTDPDHVDLVQDRETEALGDGVRIFHLNGDEVPTALKTLAARGETLSAGRNVVIPAWELPRYPEAWCEHLRQFDEVWVISNFVKESLAASGIASHRIGVIVEMPKRAHLPRRHFGIRASAFVFLAFVDLSSYSDRKNPEGALELYKRLRASQPYLDCQLVLKAKSADGDAATWLEAMKDEAADDIVFVDQPLSTFETHSLLAASDCFLSLHRAEGFGRVGAEAFWLNRPVIATGWSGSQDYMAGNPGAVDCTLIPVRPDQYPMAEGQHWAEPDIDHALSIAERFLREPDHARAAAAAGRRAVEQDCSFRAVGLRMIDRISELAGVPA